MIILSYFIVVLGVGYYLKRINSMLGWRFTPSVLLSAGVVLIYTFWRGLASSIYNEVLQVFLIIAGLLPLSFMGLHEVGGWKGLTAHLLQPSLAEPATCILLFSIRCARLSASRGPHPLPDRIRF